MRNVIHIISILLFFNLFSVESIQAKKPTAEQMLFNSTQGTEFWIALPPNEVLNWFDPVTEMYVTSAVDTKVTLEYPTLGVKLVKDISAMKITTFSNLANELNVMWEVRESEKVTNQGIRITAPDPISVYVLNAKRWSSDGFLAFPVSALGSKYIHNCYYDFHGRNALGEAKWASGFLIVAPYDNTHINIKINGIGKGFAKTLGGHEIGDEWTVTLNKGQTYLVQGDGETKGVFDISGSIVTADKPIGFFSYHQRTMIPSYDRYPGMNHLVEMMIPVTAWGKKYVTIELKRDTDLGDFFRVVASQPNTTFKGTYYDKINGNVLGHTDGFLRNPGDFMEFYELFAVAGEQYKLVRGVSVWEADKPILVTQYSYSHLLDNQILFDPFMIIVVPEEQYLYQTVFQTPSSEQFLNNWFNLIAVHDTTDLEKNDLKSITLDGTPMWTLDGNFLYNKIPTTNLYWARTNVRVGGHVVKGDTKFGGYIYGFGRVDGYGWPAAMAVDNLEELDTLPPLFTISDYCGDYDIRTTEERNGSPQDNPRQVDQGIQEIRLLNGSYNYRLDFPTPLVPFPPVYIYNFSIKVIDHTKNAYAVFSIMDRAGNSTTDSIRYYADSLTISPEQFAYGDVRVNNSKSRDFILKNEKDNSVHISGIKLKNNSVFKINKGAIPPDAEIDLDYLATYALQITYTPDKEGKNPDDKDFDTLIVETECTDFTWPLEGRGVMPRILVEDWDAGAVIVNTTKCKKTETGTGLKIMNTGTDTLTITDIIAMTAPFSLTNPYTPSLPFVIAPGEEIFLEDVCFTPSDTIDYTLDVVFRSDAFEDDSIAVLKGRGIVAGPYVTSKNWQERRLKTINDSVIYVRNSGNLNITVDGIALESAGSDFSITKITPDVNVTPIELWPEDSPRPGVTKEIVVEVRYEPQTEGAKTIKVIPTFEEQDIPPGSVYGTLDGIGIVPKIELAGYEFIPEILIGTTHPDQGFVKIKSTSQTADLWIEEIRWENPAQTDFAWVNPPPSQFLLNRNDSLMLPVTFTPAGLNRRVEAVEVVSDAATGPDINPRIITTTEVIGTAIEIGLKTDSIDFASVFLCDNSTMPFRIINNSSTNQAVIDSIVFVEGDIFSFQLNETYPITILENAYRDIPVLYSPLTAGNHYVVARIYSNFGDEYYSLIKGNSFNVTTHFALQKWTLEEQKLRDYILAPGSTLPLGLNVSTTDDWNNAQFTKFRIELAYSSNWMKYLKQINKGAVLDDTWTITVTEEYNLDNVRLIIEGEGTTPVQSNGVLLIPVFQIFLFEDKKFEPAVDFVSLADKDKCVLTTTENGYVEMSSCVIDLRSVVFSSSVYAINSIEPNPVAGDVFKVNFSVGFDSDVKLELYNPAGQLIDVYFDKYSKAGEYELTISSGSLQSGTYLLRLSSGDFIKTKNFIITK